MVDTKIEQVTALWVNGTRIDFMAAAIRMVEGKPWALLVTNPSPVIAGDEMEIRVLTEAGVTYGSRARYKFTGHARVTTTVLEGTQPLVAAGSRAN